MSDMIAESFASISSDSNFTETFLNFKRNFTQNINIDEQKDEFIDPINNPISLKEYQHTLSLTGKTSPGPDNIPYEFIKYLPKEGTEYVVKIFNFIWLNKVFPNMWREAVVIPIPKSNKNSTLPTNYRPISLTCNHCKILEKIVSERLRWKLENSKLLSPLQCGFQILHKIVIY